MSAIIRNSSGTTITGSLTNISEKITSKYVVHKLPGADKDIVQKLGVSNRYFTVSGLIFAAAGSNTQFLEALPNTTGSIVFTSNIFGVTINANHLLFYDVSLSDVGGRPMERHYSINMVEIK